MISQEFHNQRAIFIARHRGVDAIGFNAREVRTPDVAPQFQTGGENGLSHSFRWRELRGWGRRCSPALDPIRAAGLIRRGRAGEHRLPHLRAHYKFHDIRSSDPELILYAARKGIIA